MVMWPMLGAAIVAVLILLSTPKQEGASRVLLISGLIGIVLLAQLAYWAALKLDGSQPEKTAFEPLFSQPLWAAETHLPGTVGPSIEVDRAGTQVELRIGSPHRPGEWARFSAYATGPDGLTFRFDSAALGRVEVHATEIVDSWPEGATLPVTPPVETMPTRLSETTLYMSHVVVGDK